MDKRKTAVLSRMALVSCTLIWGSSFFMMKNTLDSIGSFYLLALRFSLASLMLSAVFFRKFRLLDREYVLSGAVLGIFISAGYGVQTLGLALTTPGRNAFLTAVYCLIVPFLNWLVAKKRPDAYNLCAALICLAGVGLVSVAPGGGEVNFGDALTLLGGFMFACHIVAVNRLSPGKDIVLMTLIQFITASAIFWALGLLTENFPSTLSSKAVLSLLYLGVMCTAVALLLQNVGQKYTPPSTAALLLSLEAVFGVIFSVIFTGEPLTPRLVLGFALIFASLVISEAKPGLNLRNQRE